MTRIAAVVLMLAALAACRPGASGSYGTGGPSPVPLTSPSPSVSTTPSPSGSPLPASLTLGVPYTTQAPLNDWGAHQNSCEEGAVTMVDRYLRGEREYVIDGQTAENEINALTSWQVKNWGGERDLTLDQVGQLAQGYFGYSYQVMPADEASIEAQINLGRPVIVAVMTHGLLNPDYPGYQTHYEQPNWSVYHVIDLVGYRPGGVVVNDDGIAAGRRIFYTWHQIWHGVDDVQTQDAHMYQGHLMLVITK